MQVAPKGAYRSLSIAIPRSGPFLWHWITLNILDAVLTAYLLSIGGVEGNPLLALIQGYVGSAGMLMFKVATATIVGVTICYRGHGHILRLASLLMALVVTYNAVLAFGAAPMPAPAWGG